MEHAQVEINSDNHSHISPHSVPCAAVFTLTPFTSSVIHRHTLVTHHVSLQAKVPPSRRRRRGHSHRPRLRLIDQRQRPNIRELQPLDLPLHNRPTRRPRLGRRPARPRLRRAQRSRHRRRDLPQTSHAGCVTHPRRGGRHPQAAVDALTGLAQGPRGRLPRRLRGRRLLGRRQGLAALLQDRRARAGRAAAPGRPTSSSPRGTRGR